MPWSELAPFVHFVCDDLDSFMESIRVYFDSIITEDMKARERERLQKERDRKLQAERLRLEATEVRRKEQLEAQRTQEKRRRAKMDEEVRRRYEQDMSRRIAEARENMERDAILTYQKHLEEYKVQLADFEKERLHQWFNATKEQDIMRKDYEAQQRQAVQKEMTELWNRKTALKWREWSKRTMLNREEAVLKYFSKELGKPIDEQIKDAFNFSRKYLTDEDFKIDKLCRGRRFALSRIEMLLALDKVAKDPQSFIPLGISQPVPIKKPTPTLPRRYHSHPQYVTTPPPIIPEWELPYGGPQSPSSVISTSSESHSPFSGSPRPLSYDVMTLRRRVSKYAQLLDDDNSHSEDERPGPQVKKGKEENESHARPTLEKLGVNEIQQRDNITSLQTRFQQLDRSAIASMLKGKQTFNRSSDLKFLLQHSRICEASDQRDRVYAFLGLAHNGYGIYPDYTARQDIKKVLIEAAKGIIRFDKSLDILRHVHRGRNKLGSQLPTWVPDWTSEETKALLDQREWNRARPFDAAKGTLADFEFKSDGHEDLRVKGVFVDSIQHTDYDSSTMDEFMQSSTTQGDCVIGPKSTRADDEVWVLYGSTWPVLLRQNGDSRYGYLGDVLIYVDQTNDFSEVMFGQMIDQSREGSLRRNRERTIWIV